MVKSPEIKWLLVICYGDETLDGIDGVLYLKRGNIRFKGSAALSTSLCSARDDRSDNVAEITAKSIRKWWNELGTKTLYIEPGSPWENGYIESFNGKFRDELLNRDIFYTLQEAKIVIERWQMESNQVRPHSASGYKPPAPQVVLMPQLTATLLSSLPQGLT